MTADEVIQKCSSIPSSVYEPEQRMWHELVSPLDSPVIVDFGTGHGKSAASFALSNPSGHVWTFDPGEPYGETPEQYTIDTNKFIADTGASNFTFRRESSLETEWDQPIDVLNIDSSHTYEQTFAEINRWVPFVKVGGYVFFHDYEHPRCPGIKQAIDELIPSKFKLKLQRVTEAGDVHCAFYIKEE